jgi:hypothetical protein
MEQTASTIVMIRPFGLGMKAEMVVTNENQKAEGVLLPSSLETKTVEEFDILVERLRAVGVDVVVVDSQEGLPTLDSVFVSHWLSFHGNGNVALYPLFAVNRRLERCEGILDRVEERGFVIDSIIDYTSAEADGFFLEGGGSMVLDRENSKAYCALSTRSDEELFIEFCEDFEFTPIFFEAFETVNSERKAMNHTSMMMCLGATFAVICTDCIEDKKERKMVLDSLKSDGKQVVLITEDQMSCFAGNMLEVKGAEGKRYLVMSDSAYQSLTRKQLSQLEDHVAVLSSGLESIESGKGGSVGSMMAVVFLPRE